MLKHIITTAFLLAGTCCTITIRAQDSTAIKENSQKLITFLFREIHRYGAGDTLFDRAPCIAMLAFHVNEIQKIDSMSVQCSDSVMTAIIKRARYDQLSVNWLCLLPATAAKTVRNQRLTFYIPLFFIKALDGPDKPAFSKNDIDAFLGTGDLTRYQIYYLQNSTLLNPIGIRLSRSH